jgi:2-amino-4-hydroxy-6-hydroxymethyldihydropteridine diphosphokinase
MRALIALGSNLGDRRAVLDGAAAELGRLPGVRVLAISPWLETPPELPSDGGPYLNGAALIETNRVARALLADLLALERRWGRVRDGTRGARTLDLDLVLLGHLVLQGPGLEVPHPRFAQRRFVLEPAAAVAPDLLDPRSGKSLRRLLGELLP